MLENQGVGDEKALRRAPGASIWVPLAVFGLAFAVRVLYLIALKSSVLFNVMVVDAALYDNWGMHIAAGNWLGDARAFYDPPLYAYFLGIIYRTLGHDYFVVRLVQIIIGSAHCVVIWALATRIQGRRAGAIAGLLAALYKPLIFYDAAIMKAFLTTALIDVSLLALLHAIGRRRAAWWFLSGILLGLLATIRVNMLAFATLGLAIFGYGIIRGRWPGGRAGTLKACAAWGLGIVLVLMPVGLRNLKASGQFILVSSYMGQNFYTGNNPYNTSGNYQRVPFVRANPKYEEEDFRNEAEKRTGISDMNARQVSNYWMEQSIDYILSDPLAFVRRLALRFRIFWNVYEVPDTYNMDFEARNFTPYLKLPFFNFGLIAPLGLIGLALMWRERRRLWPFYFFIVMYMATIVPFFVFARYRLQVTGVLIAFAGAGAAKAWELRPRLGRLAAVCASFMALAVLVNYPLPNRVPDSEGFLNLGTIWREKGDLDKAEESYRKSIALNPGVWQAYYFLATTLRENGKCGEAIKEYAVLLQNNPDFADAMAGTGICMEQAGNDEKAIELYSRALELRMNLSDIRLRLIRLLIKRGDIEQARLHLLTLMSIDPSNKEGIELMKKYGAPIKREPQ